MPLGKSETVNNDEEDLGPLQDTMCKPASDLVQRCERCSGEEARTVVVAQPGTKPVIEIYPDAPSSLGVGRRNGRLGNGSPDLSPPGSGLDPASQVGGQRWLNCEKFVNQLLGVGGEGTNLSPVRQTRNPQRSRFQQARAEQSQYCPRRIYERVGAIALAFAKPVVPHLLESSEVASAEGDAAGSRRGQNPGQRVPQFVLCLRDKPVPHDTFDFGPRIAEDNAISRGDDVGSISMLVSIP